MPILCTIDLVKTRRLSAIAVILIMGCTGTPSVVPPSPSVVASPSQSVVATPSRTDRPGGEASTCGKLIDYASSSPTELLLTLEIRHPDQTTNTWRYRLAGPGTAPSDLGTQFAAGRPQVLYIYGWFAPINPLSPSEISVTDYSVMRITEPCPMTL
jgi:hypothetical protein